MSHPIAVIPWDGKDLLPVLTGQAPVSERTLYWRMANRSQRAIRKGDWKYLKVRDRNICSTLATTRASVATWPANARICSTNYGGCGKIGTGKCWRFPTAWFHHFRTCRRCSGNHAGKAMSIEMTDREQEPGT